MLAGLWLNQVQILTFSKFSWAPFLVLSMTACNALASVINEFGLKQHHSANINLQNALLFLGVEWINPLGPFARSSDPSRLEGLPVAGPWFVENASLVF